ncbi:MAG: flavodoxin family protein [Oscillospiraceae bacterium]|jgi:hypothetical protein|nr:flavodoxin family protein [Oscillospiraceae bacterium]
MKAAVRYQSRGGNTRAVAEAIASALGIQAESIGAPITEKVDVLFVGGGVYAWDADKRLTAWLKDIDRDNVGEIAAFGTAGGMSSVITRVQRIAAEIGIPVNAHTLMLKMLHRGYALLGMHGGNLTDAQKEKSAHFAMDVTADWEKRHNQTR